MIQRRVSRRPVRFAVVGLGAIAQAAVLPAFANAREAELAALVSDDEAKLRRLGKAYGVERVFGYDGFEEAMHWVDAVYLCLPNHLHREYTVRAAAQGVHVLCEKPMAPSGAECEEMIDACAANGVHLMIAYRLHLEAATLAAVEAAGQGRLGELRYFSSQFSFPIRPGNVRVRPEPGAGPLWDIGIYCVNAARMLFRDEPERAMAELVRGRDERSAHVEEAVAATLAFPGGRLAQFTVSFAAAPVNALRLVGTAGDLVLDPAYDYSLPPRLSLTIDGRTRERAFPRHDQFAAELAYFARCIRREEEPEPSGEEGLADVRVVEALLRSAESGGPERVSGVERRRRPSPRQPVSLPPPRHPRATVGIEEPEDE